MGQTMQPIELIDHPEGGRFREVFRSPARVSTSAGESRSALTHIYFSLRRGEVSRFHRVRSDEVWNLYQGQGLRLITWDGSHHAPLITELSLATQDFCAVVPAGHWQAAEPIGDDLLVGCTVGPGFEFADFELMDPDSKQAGWLRSVEAGMERWTGPGSASANGSRP